MKYKWRPEIRQLARQRPGSRRRKKNIARSPRAAIQCRQGQEKSLDREFLLQHATQLVEPFQALSLNEYRGLPFASLPPASRQQPHERAKAYYASIAQLAQRQEELAKFAHALITFTLCRGSDPRKQELTSAERQFVTRHLPQLHPVSCPVLDVEQNAKEPSLKIEQRIETALWNASRSLVFDTLNVMHSLVLARVLGRIDWFHNDGCRFFYYENQILQSKRWPAIHICEAVAVAPRHVELLPGDRQLRLSRLDRSGSTAVLAGVVSGR